MSEHRISMSEIWISMSEIWISMSAASPGPRFRSCAGSDSPKHWHLRTVPVRKTSSWAAPAAVARYWAAATGQSHRAASGPFKLYSPGPRFRSCAGSDSPKHWRVRAVPVRKTSSWAAPAAVAQSRYPSGRLRHGVYHFNWYIPWAQ